MAVMVKGWALSYNYIHEVDGQPFKWSGTVTNAIGGKKTMADESTTQATEPEQQNTTETAQAIDYEKIEQMINKGTQQKESAILKSYFQQQGMTEDEAKQAMTAYKEDKASKESEQAQSFEAMKAENETLKARILQGQIDAQATATALDMGVSKNSVPYLIKMADLSKVVDEKGEIAEDLLKTALEQVLTDIPALKESATANAGFVQVGADGNNQDKLEDDILRKAAGLPPKKK